jgi:hypothetical protein
MKKGQIALVVLIISAVVMTLGLSLSKKSVVETKITTDEELLKQAFNAAESGVDYYLGTGQTYFPGVGNGVANVTVNSNLGAGAATVNLGGLTLRNNNNYVWMVGHNNDGSLNTGQNMNTISSLNVCVKDAFAGNLLVSFFYISGGKYMVSRSFGPVTAGLAGCSGVSGLGSGVDLTSMLGGGKQPLLLVVKPVADDTKTAVSAGGGVTFPSQGVEISSIGKAGDVTGSSIDREVNVVNQYQVPSFMLEAVTAGGSVLSN